MISCFLQGGLGNQMFQIAAAVSLALDNNQPVAFDFKKHYLPLQGRPASVYDKTVFRNIINKQGIITERIFEESDNTYKKIPHGEGVTLSGYFQSEKYFVNHKEKIRELFAPSDEIRRYIEEKYSRHLIEEATSIHIRRGDYLRFKDVHPPCSSDYYVQAMSLFPKTTKYLIVSDDPKWCSKVFKSNNYKIVEGEEDYVDLYLMSMCKNNIIANSSFSWWGAWLNNCCDKKVVAPNKWFGSASQNNTKDLFPAAWIIV
jgi:hypothetical protein